MKFPYQPSYLNIISLSPFTCIIFFNLFHSNHIKHYNKVIQIFVFLIQQRTYGISKWDVERLFTNTIFPFSLK